MSAPSAPDVSVILNIHREAPYIRRTVKSLNEAALHAAATASIRSELVVVFDRSDALTKEVTRAAPADAFVSIRYIEVDHGSLGLARNSGIELARGQHIWLADADDLVSYNCIAQMHAIVVKNPNAAVFPEYLIAFGEDFWVAKYYDDSTVTTADFVYGHPYISRIFLNRKRLDGLKFLDLRLSSGFAYEDWHFNAELRAFGIEFRIAPQTIFFYRQRKDSLLKQANAASVKQIPHSTLFSPDIFSMRVAREEEMAQKNKLDARREAARIADPKEILDAPICLDMMAAASRIDPGVNLHLIRHAEKTWTNVFPNRHWGHDYALACTIVGKGPFTDIVLLPSLVAGGGEKYILDVLHALAIQQPGFRCLVISGEAALDHAWLDRLPASCIFLDVFNAFPWTGDQERDLLVLRLLLAVKDTNARLHLKDSVFAKRWFGKFSAVAGRLFKAVYYRFSDERIPFGTGFVDLGWSFDFISSEIENLSWIVCDHKRIIQTDHERLGVYNDKWHCLYAAAHTAHPIERHEFPSYRLLWASRISQSKRPDLLPQIARALRRMAPHIQIDVAGFANKEDCWIRQIASTEGLRYLGPFDTFAALGPQHYDAFIYTSAYDGLPNVILEAMSHGLPVVAPDVGGLHEAIEPGKTGWLVPQAADDEALVNAYVDAIVELYRNWAHSQAMGMAARDLVIERHSDERHRRDVDRILLGLE